MNIIYVFDEGILSEYYICDEPSKSEWILKANKKFDKIRRYKE